MRAVNFTAEDGNIPDSVGRDSPFSVLVWVWTAVQSLLSSIGRVQVVL